MKKILTLVALSGALLLFSCEEKTDTFNYFYYEPEDWSVLSEYLNLPTKPLHYSGFYLRSHLWRSGLRVQSINDDRATLGRVLFYDKKLSKDGTIACASCHKPERAFSDDVAFSQGVEGFLTERNSIALGAVANFSAYYGTDLNGANAVPFFWDNRAATASEQATASLTHPHEMGMRMEDVVAVVQAQPYYGPLLRKAFKTAEAGEWRIQQALSSFVYAMVSEDSRFDAEAEKLVNQTETYGLDAIQELLRQDFPGFTAEENLGKTLYLNNCAACHSPIMGRPVMNNADNGLNDDNGVAADPGVGAISGKPEDLGTFKVPTLRNIALTAPYMHDGRFPTLEAVVDHYSSGIRENANLHPLLRDGAGQPGYMNFSAIEKQALVAFLNTLTDTRLLTSPRFSNPFK